MTDIVLGGMSGIDLLKEIKISWPEAEVIVMTCYASTASAIMATRYGAFDYILKNYDDLDTITKVVKNAVHKFQEGEKERRFIRHLKQNIEELKRTNIARKRLAHHHEMTDPFNELNFQEALETELVRSRENNRVFSVVLVGLDSYLEYTEQDGTSEIESLYANLFLFLKKHIRGSDFIVQWAQNRFCFLLPETDKEGARGFSRSIHQTLNEYPCSEQGDSLFRKESICLGSATFPDDGKDITGLFEHACKQLTGVPGDREIQKEEVV
jgi:diguanylate cyclase (GGDEF)-like protein